MAKIIPGKTEPSPLGLPVFGAKTDRVLWLPAAMIRVSANAAKTRISKAPSTTPVRVDSRMPR